MSEYDGWAADHPRPASLRHLLHRSWASLGLTTQFLLLVTLLVLALSYFSGLVQKSIAARAMIESSLEIEQALAQVALSAVIGNEPLSGSISPEMTQALQDVVSRKLDPRYFDKIKVWGVDGQLLFDSRQDIGDRTWEEPAVMRALSGETVMSQADARARENAFDMGLGEQVYEVYMPIRASDGRILAVGEIYCSVDLLVDRLEIMQQQIDRVRALIAAIGISALGLLVYFAHCRINTQGQALARTLANSEELVRRNARLFAESEQLRREAAESSERLLNHIGAELHDGPIQLLSLAALYRARSGTQSGAQSREGMQGNDAKAEQLLQQALTELRNTSSGLVLPELDGLDLQQAVAKAVQAFITETGIAVHSTIAPVPGEVTKPKLVVAYRIVYEALNNARKHAGGKGLQVDLAMADDGARICISDQGPGLCDRALQDRPRVRLGLQYMAHRASSVGGSLTVNATNRDGTGTAVQLHLPLKTPGSG